MLLPSHFRDANGVAGEIAASWTCAGAGIPLELLQELNGRLYECSNYAPNTPKWIRPSMMQLKARRGVCQDFAQYHDGTRTAIEDTVPVRERISLP